MGENEIWWQRDPSLFGSFKREIEDFEFLGIAIEDSKVVLRGHWPVFGLKDLITRYEIEVLIPDNYPIEVPMVFETGGRVPKEPDYHINPGNNTACLFAEPERYEKWPCGSGIRDFLNGPVKEFFFSQAYKAMTGQWPFGEWSHGDEGILEYYARRLGTGQLDQLEPLLTMAILPKYNRQWKCPCRSKMRVTRCHSERLQFLRQTIPVTEIERAIEIIRIWRLRKIKDVRLRA